MAQLGTPEYTQELIKKAQALGANASGFFGTQKSSPPTSSVLKPGGWETLNNAPAFNLPNQPSNIVPQVYSSSLGGPTPSTSAGGKQDYTQPIGTYSAGGFQPSTPAVKPPPLPQPKITPPSTYQRSVGGSSIFSGALNALKNAVGNVASGIKQGASNLFSNTNNQASVIGVTQPTASTATSTVENKCIMYWKLHVVRVGGFTKNIVNIIASTLLIT